MPTLFYVPQAGAEIFLRTRDEHCPPHVHAKNISEKWEIKVLFSYVDGDSKHLVYEPIRGKSKASQVNKILDVVNDKMDLCGEKWWNLVKKTCLENKKLKVSAAGIVTLSSNGVLVREAKYEASTKSVYFRNKIPGPWAIGTSPRKLP